MAFFDFLKRNNLNLEHKEAPRVHMQQTTPYHNRQDNYKSYAKEGYQQNAVVFKCVNEISNAAASINFKVYQGDVELEQHPLLTLLKKPNPIQAGNEYFQSLYAYILLSGNSFAISSTAGGVPSELHLLRPDRVEIIPSNTSIPKGYNYMLNGKVAKTYEADPFTGQSEVKHFKTWNPLDDYLGMSPLMAASIDVDQHNLIAKHNIALLVNGARPSGAVIFKPTDTSGAPMMMSDVQRKQIKDDLDRRMSGTNNSGKPMLLEGDFDWKEMGMTPKDMDFLQNKHMAAKDIALCFGIPSQIIGIPDSQTYSNIQEARLAMYEETIIPLAMRVCNDLNEWLSPSYGDDIRIDYDYDSIPAMVERRKRVYENVTAAVREGIITRNEARDRLGLTPIEGGDDVFIAANLFPLGSPIIPPASGSDAEDDSKSAYGEKSEIRKDVFTTEDEAIERANEIGCVGSHSHTENGETIYMPCNTHSSYVEATGEDLKDSEDKAESDIDTKPTEAMAINGKRALDLRKEHKRGMTSVGVARANQLIARERLSPRTVRRMKSFFARHEVDKQAQGFRRGEDGYPSAGLIAWLGWGGDEGQSWANRKVTQLDKEREKYYDLEKSFTNEDIMDVKAKISEAVKKGLAEKVKDHNENHGDKKGKRVTQGMLEAVFRRGVGAYQNNPQSVRPSVSSADQWAYARVNGFLSAVRTGRFKSGKYDTDLLPKDHPLSTKE
jgi:HK97 family phage portal protein